MLLTPNMELDAKILKRKVIQIRYCKIAYFLHNLMSNIAIKPLTCLFKIEYSCYFKEYSKDNKKTTDALTSVVFQYMFICSKILI